MIQNYKVIEVKIKEHDGDSYYYVTKIDVDQYGKIVIVTSPDVLNAMKFMYESDNEELIILEKMLKLVKSYFPKKNHTITYRILTVEVK